MNLLHRLTSAASLVTILRYALQALGGILVANGNFDAGQWETISGAVLVIVPMLLGVRSTITPKVVTPSGDTVKLPDLPRTTQTVVIEQATTAAKQHPTLLDRLFGR